MKFILALVSLWAVLMLSACTDGAPTAQDTTVATTPAAPDTRDANTPPTPCEDAIDQRTLTECWSEASRTEQGRVAAAVKKLDELFASKTSPSSRQQWQDDQRRWHEFVEGHCGLYGGLLDGGSAAPMAVAVCRWQLAQTRMQLLARLTDELDR